MCIPILTGSRGTSILVMIYILVGQMLSNFLSNFSVFLSFGSPFVFNFGFWGLSASYVDVIASLRTSCCVRSEWVRYRMRPIVSRSGSSGGSVEGTITAFLMTDPTRRSFPVRSAMFRAYNTVIRESRIPGSRSFFSGIQIPLLIQKYRVFRTNLKNIVIGYDLFTRSL
jgi:hypothetical protein